MSHRSEIATLISLGVLLIGGVVAAIGYSGPGERAQIVVVNASVSGIDHTIVETADGTRLRRNGVWGEEGVEMYVRALVGGTWAPARSYATLFGRRLR